MKNSQNTLQNGFAEAKTSKIHGLQNDFAWIKTRKIHAVARTLGVCALAFGVLTFSACASSVVAAKPKPAKVVVKKAPKVVVVPAPVAPPPKHAPHHAPHRR